MLIATLPPQARHSREIAADLNIDQLRLNTGVDLGQSPADMLDTALFKSGAKPLLIDLKARQLRITKWVDPGFEHVSINHKISVNTPCKVIFRDSMATVVDVINGDKLVLEDPPESALGAGQSININDPSLVIEGFLTPRDHEFIEAAKSRGLHRYLLSFVEREEDIIELLALDPKAEIICKIESRKGLKFVENVYPKYADRVRLMCARDDLYTNIGSNKLEMLDAERLIIENDPNAIVASRILTSAEKSKNQEISLADLKDLESLFNLGYRNFMLSDTLCLNRDAFNKAVKTFEEFQKHRQSKTNENIFSLKSSALRLFPPNLTMTKHHP